MPTPRATDHLRMLRCDLVLCMQVLRDCKAPSGECELLCLVPFFALTKIASPYICTPAAYIPRTRTTHEHLHLLQAAQAYVNESQAGIA